MAIISCTTPSPAIKAVKNRREYERAIINKLDTDGDGKLSEEELAKADKDGNGIIEGTELGIDPEVERYFFLRTGAQTNPEIELDLCNADLRDQDLRGIDFSHTILRGADLRGSNLNYSIFKGVDLSGADLSKAQLRFANFDSANLSGCNLNGSDAIFSSFRRANLGGAHVVHANLEHANLQRADISGAEIIGTSFNLSLVGGIISDRPFLKYAPRGNPDFSLPTD